MRPLGLWYLKGASSACSPSFCRLETRVKNVMQDDGNVHSKNAERRNLVDEFANTNHFQSAPIDSESYFPVVLFVRTGTNYIRELAKVKTCSLHALPK